MLFTNKTKASLEINMSTLSFHSERTKPFAVPCMGQGAGAGGGVGREECAAEKTSWWPVVISKREKGGPFI